MVRPHRPPLERVNLLADHLWRVAHATEFIQHGIDAAWTDKQHSIGQPAGDLLGEFLARQQFLGENRVFGQH